ncbi:hypothetical protein [Polaribacter cellanae]|uniref:Polymer-forming cytoskeletal protein n=1 Tax=Polaribacter cellanae TaxID=2818493 RepID=A0A975CQ52_9FLAO|nr:hypothetical protein [Polaribacter cellanae]QTE21146.1 hypothetical protein J3359_09810 [Polaribacter cellanae]
MLFLKKIKAGALQYVLVISVVIGIIIFAFISLIYLQQKMTLKHQFSKKAIHNTLAGFDYLRNNTIAYDEEKIFNFFDEKNTETAILKKHWGVFDLAIVTSKVKNEVFEKIGLLGVKNSERKALYLKDNNQSLVLVGNTKITGNAQLPKQGVKTGSIGGFSYYGNSLVNGIKTFSSNELPKIKNLAYLKNFFSSYQKQNISEFELENNLKLHNSFTENTLLYEDENIVQLENVSLSGNIILVSKKSIHIKSTAKLKDVILIAPEIIIESNVTGNFQAFANKKIIVGENCLLMYPTVLSLFENNENQNSEKNKIEINQIKIAENSEVRGVVLFETESISTNYNAQVSIEKNAIIKGEIYCAKNLDLQGSVFGSVYTSNFIVNKFGGIFVNHIYNGVINSKELPLEYAGLQIHQDLNTVAKWLN